MVFFEAGGGITQTQVKYGLWPTMRLPESHQERDLRIERGEALEPTSASPGIQGNLRGHGERRRLFIVQEV